MNFIYKVLLFYYLFTITEGHIRLTNIKCNALHKSFATFEKCYLKLLRRDTVALNIHVKLHQLPVANVSFNLQLLKKANGYRPFLYNVTGDFCRFIKKSNHLSFEKIFFDLLLKGSNINHSCPYNHDIIVDKLVLDASMFRFLPLPTGDYMFNLKVAAYNDWKADVKAYVEQVE